MLLTLLLLLARQRHRLRCVEGHRIKAFSSDPNGPGDKWSALPRPTRVKATLGARSTPACRSALAAVKEMALDRFDRLRHVVGFVIALILPDRLPDTAAAAFICFETADKVVRVVKWGARAPKLLPVWVCIKVALRTSCLEGEYCAAAHNRIAHHVRGRFVVHAKFFTALLACLVVSIVLRSSAVSVQTGGSLSMFVTP